MNYAEKLGIKRNIVFTGWLSREDMKKAYAVCDVCVTPSIYFDAFNLFNIEAGASKKPVIGTCFGGTPEIIQNDVSGIIINPNNREMFRDAINQVIDDENLAKRLGDGGYKRVREYFSMDRFVKEHLDRYQD
jgi:glycosyltransferase involved in cell wall biosynthesis